MVLTILNYQERQHFFQLYASLKEFQAPLMNEIMLKLRLMHLDHTESTSIGADNPTNVNPPVAYSSTTADFLEHKLSVALPD